MKTFDDFNNEIKKNIVALWTRNGHSVRNVENDPVINLLLSALSYQAYHILNKIEQVETKTVREFRDRVLPYNMIKPVPAFSIMEAKLKEGCNEKMMDETCSFELQNLKKQKLNFSPLLTTKILNADLTMSFQTEDNVWRVKLESQEPIHNLSYLSLFVGAKYVTIESISCCGEELPLIKPNQFNELPFTKWFNNSHLFLHQNFHLFGSYNYWQEIFLNSSAQLYYIAPYEKRLPKEGEKEIELDIRFNIPVEANNILKINCIPVVNVELKEISLDEKATVKDLTTETGEFLNLYSETGTESDYQNILIRQFDVERYNSYQLFDQIQELLNRYKTDYFAFLNNRELLNSGILNALQRIMVEIINMRGELDEKMVHNHFYAILKTINSNTKRVDIKYFVTAGAFGNGIKKEEKITKAPAGIDVVKTCMLFDTRGGRNLIKDETQKQDIAQYYYLTKDRLVTLADINIFIKTFYFENGRLSDEISNISLKREEEYMCVNIALKNDSYIKKTNKTEYLSEILENKISLRSSGILPFRVNVS